MGSIFSRREPEQTSGIFLPISCNDVTVEPESTVQEILRIVDPYNRNVDTDTERLLEEFKALHEFKKNKEIQNKFSGTEIVNSENYANQRLVNI